MSARIPGFEDWLAGWQQPHDAWQQFLDMGRAAAAQASASSAVDPAGAFAAALRSWRQAQTAPMGGLFAVPGIGPAAPAPDLAQQQLRVQELQWRLWQHWQTALTAATTTFSAHAAATAAAGSEDGAQAPKLSALYDLWIDCAEEAYANEVHGETYCRDFAEFTNATQTLRNSLRRHVEEWARQLDLPTRSDLDALLRRVQQLEAAAERTAATASAPRAKRAASRTKRRAPPKS
ncbi:MAG TPA: poly(R)-hydroxyalkanoic acid synthase subunit PhaE [Steroidobacteraceae bacterium]|nr:poly(R)-hydroxyalkanoic acid synthase subunit PhaE [Steroidobacteraceae bacterium]HRX88644.1 poly(R)-hydroxyalkanoic acid synthase subunit PhaE [Steroidobacteraceae bacterium]